MLNASTPCELMIVSASATTRPRVSVRRRSRSSIGEVNHSGRDVASSAGAFAGRLAKVASSWLLVNSVHRTVNSVPQQRMMFTRNRIVASD
jgi:hypothetical protein